MNTRAFSSLFKSQKVFIIGKKLFKICGGEGPAMVFRGGSSGMSGMSADIPKILQIIKIIIEFIKIFKKVLSVLEMPVENLQIFRSECYGKSRSGSRKFR